MRISLEKQVEMLVEVTNAQQKQISHLFEVLETNEVVLTRLLNVVKDLSDRTENLRNK